MSLIIGAPAFFVISACIIIPFASLYKWSLTSKVIYILLSSPILVLCVFLKSRGGLYFPYFMWLLDGATYGLEQIYYLAPLYLILNIALVIFVSIYRKNGSSPTSVS
jgi:hypothetical protein